MFDMVLNMPLEKTQATSSYYLGEGCYCRHITSHPFIKFCSTCPHPYHALFAALFVRLNRKSDFNGQSIGGKMEIRLEKPATNNFKAYLLQK